MDLIIQENSYNSLFFKGGSWLEFQTIDSIKMNSNTNDFSLQFWVSGGVIDTNQAPALFSFADSNGEIKLSVLRDPNLYNRIIPIINSQVYSEEINNLDFSDPNFFYLISIIFSNNSNIKIYIDSTFIEYTVDTPLDFNDEMLIVGAVGNKERTTLKNFWYGYIDEIRLWNTHLSDSTIKFQSKYPSKLGENYRYTDEDDNERPTYLDSLVGLWRLNFELPQNIINDESEHDNNGNIFTLNGFSVELSEKSAEK